jgi:hypothetical protein
VEKTQIFAAKLLEFWGIGFLCAAVGCAVLFEVPRIVALQRNSARTTGAVVMRYEPQKHGTAVIRYIVSGKTYEKSFGGVPYGAGQSVQIYYLPSRPETSLLEDPGSALRPAFVYTGAGSAFLSTGWIWILYSRRRVGRQV